MNKITIGIFEEHKLLMDGICEILKSVDSFEITIKERKIELLYEQLSISNVNILIISNLNHDSNLLIYISKIKRNFPAIKTLVLSHSDNEKEVLKTIKSGASGFIGNESDKSDLIEAIYTLRNGHEYYSKSITHLLLNRYISNMNDGNVKDELSKSLSEREREIVRLWGNSLSNPEIADKLYISIRTVESHKNHIMQKLNLKTTVDLIKFGIKNNLIEI